MKKESIIEQIIAYIIGHKYYAVILNRRGTDMLDLSSFVFPNYEQAEEYCMELHGNASFTNIEIISFRSHLDIALLTNNQGNRFNKRIFATS